MKASEECYGCLALLVRQAAELAVEEPGLRTRAIEEGLSLLNREFSTEKTSIAVATPLHRIVRNVTENPDPYLRMKEEEVRIAAELCKLNDRNPEGDLKSCIIKAVLGNSIDFFKEPKAIQRDLAMPVQFVIDDTDQLQDMLKEAGRILYLADNTGEVFFDLPLVRKLGGLAAVTYVVKESPVQNDVTLADLKRFGLAGELTRVITTGTDTPGVDMDIASDEFRSEFDAADLVLAKGMGYWETLSELPAGGNVLHLLKAKCRPVADSLGVALNSYVALLR